MQEVWKDIYGYEGYYQISNLGRVKSLSRTYIGKGGCVRYVKETFLKSETDTDGYIKYRLHKKQNQKGFKRSVLIARHFIPNPYNLPVVRHLNDINTDDRIENLAWGTHKDNTQDAIRNGKFPKGEKHWMFGKEGKNKGKNRVDAFYGKPYFNGKLVLDTATGIFYESIREAAMANNINEDTLTWRMRSNKRVKTSMIFV